MATVVQTHAGRVYHPGDRLDDGRMPEAVVKLAVQNGLAEAR